MLVGNGYPCTYIRIVIAQALGGLSAEPVAVEVVLVSVGTSLRVWGGDLVQKTALSRDNLAGMYPGDGTLKSGDQKCATTPT